MQGGDGSRSQTYRSSGGIGSMTAGTCLEHPHHDALLQFAQVPRMHIVCYAVSMVVDGGVEDCIFCGRQSRNQIHCRIIMGMAKCRTSPTFLELRLI